MKAFKFLALSAVLSVPTVYAEVTINGFANIVAGQTSNQDSLWGYDDEIDFSEESLFGLQVSSAIDEKLGVTAQIISRGSEDWDAEFEWAYITYDVSEEWRLLAGRQRIPFYMYSDFLDVSYAYPWITPPRGVYSFPIDTFEGITSLYNFSVGSFDALWQLSYGVNKEEFNTLGLSFDGELRALGNSLTLTKDWLTLRAAYFSAETTLENDDISALAQAWQGTPFPDVTDQMLNEDDNGSFIEMGFQIDYNNFLLLGEYTEISIDNSIFADSESMYLTAGYRMDNVLFHYTYGRDTTDTVDLISDVPLGVDPTLDFLATSSQAISTLQKENSIYHTFGVRWDFHETAALKFEMTDYADGTFNQDVNLARVAFVTVF